MAKEKISNGGVVNYFNPKMAVAWLGCFRMDCALVGHNEGAYAAYYALKLKGKITNSIGEDGRVPNTYSNVRVIVPFKKYAVLSLATCVYEALKRNDAGFWVNNGWISVIKTFSKLNLDECNEMYEVCNDLWTEADVEGHIEDSRTGISRISLNVGNPRTVARTFLEMTNAMSEDELIKMIDIVRLMTIYAAGDGLLDSEGCYSKEQYEHVISIQKGVCHE